MPSMKWKRDDFGKDDRSLYLGEIFVGGVDDFDNREPNTPWRAWFRSNEDGEMIGKFPTIEAARSALEERLNRALALL